METLAFSHVSLAHEEAEYLEPDAYELKLFQGLNWTPPSSAWIGLIASLMTLVSLATNVQAAYVRTNGSPLRLRAAPAGRIIGSLRNGSYISVSGNSSGSWTQLTNPRGWVSSRWISGGGGSGGGGGGGGNPSTGAYVRTQGDPLNVRSSPGGSVVGSLRNGTYITLSGRTSGSWAQLSNGNWVASSLISRSSGGSGGGGGGNPSTSAYVRTKGDPLNVRSSPGGPIVGSLSNGSSITLSGRTSGSWVQLSNGNWVASSLISRTGGGSGVNPSATLQRGSSGQAVTNLQNRLKTLGFYNGSITGYYGDLTEAAVRSFQGSRGIQVNGIAGPQTQAALYNYAYNAGSGGGGGGYAGSDYTNASTNNQTRYEAYISTSGNAIDVYSSPNGRVVGNITNGERLLLTGRRSGFWVQAADGTWLDEQYVRYSGRTF
ncbi:MAG TPA: peptidoglycan-binding protein [Allocoleopsis sp.]